VETKTDAQKTVLPSDLIFDKMQDGGGRHFEIQFTGHISVATAHISTNLHIGPTSARRPVFTPCANVSVANIVLLKLSTGAPIFAVT